MAGTYLIVCFTHLLLPIDMNTNPSLDIPKGKHWSISYHRKLLMDKS